ncbi:MAG: chromosome segregation protein SMC [Acidobacteria bacterium]|nr:MAG: chromosome segregation protein SMC [Acidobacteriota bacterium]
MYHLDRMEIRGFKSFPDKTDILFPQKITAVVGPNGCGKSNISDAIQWVLGEQRVRVLRGDSMQDVIFNGSESRKPQGMAEVSLTFIRDLSKPPPSAEAPLFVNQTVQKAGSVEAPAGGNGEGGAQGNGNGAADPAEHTGGDGAGPEALAAEGNEGPALQDALEAGGTEVEEGNGRGARALEERWPESLKITRRLFRNGESDYRIDGNRCRLRDIQDLLRRIAVGSGASTIIEQGKIAQMVSSRPKDRRLLIEEAAGIAGFKAKKREATLKLEATEANLVRLEDIIGEVRRQINSLKRQASKARRYQRLMEERRRLARVHILHRSGELDGRLGELRGQAADFQDRDASAAADLARAQAHAEELRARLDEGERELTEGRDTLHGLDLTVDREERSLAGARQQARELREAAERDDRESGTLEERRARTSEEIVGREGQGNELGDDLRRFTSQVEEGEARVEQARQSITAGEGKLEELRREQLAMVDVLSDLRGRLLRLQEDGERAQAAAERSSQEAGEARQQCERLAAELAAMDAAQDEAARKAALLEETSRDAGRRVSENRQRLEQVDHQGEQAREDRTSLAERLQSLESLDRDESPQGRATRAAGEDGRGVVADFVSPDREMEAAADAFLGDLLPAVVLDDAAATLRAVERLRDADAGGGSFLLPLAGMDTASLPPELDGDPRVVGMLAEALEAHGAAQQVVQSAAGQAVLVRDLAAALELAARFPRLAFVTTAGEVVHPGGLVRCPRARRSERGILTLRRRIQETRNALADAESRTRQAAESRTVLRQEIEAQEVRAAKAAVERAEVDVSLAELRERRKALCEQHDQAGRLRQVREEEAEAQRRDCESGLQQMDAGREEQSKAEQRRATLESSLRSCGGELETQRRLLAELQDQQAGARTGLEGSRARLEALAQELAHLGEVAEDLAARALRCRQEANERRTTAAGQDDLATRTESSLRSNLELRKAKQDSLETAAAALDEVRQESKQRVQEARSLQAALEEVRQGKSEVEVALTRVESEREFLDRSCREDLDQSVAEAVAAVAPEDAGLSAEAVAEELAEVKRKIDSLGPVNVMAVDEFTELEERYTFLLAQQKDLQESVRSLRETITRINKQSRERFRFAFEQVRSNFSEIFRFLFGGGRADLILEEGEDVLEAGVDITAQPPGKRLQNIALLSGGEKALTALSVLFAIFRFRPSPFCVLDEADAPLDEANIQRFNQLIRSMSDDTQFVLITHSKRTMETSDVLYGVTMEEPGVSRLVSVCFGEDGRLSVQDENKELALDGQLPTRGVPAPEPVVSS